MAGGAAAAGQSAFGCSIAGDAAASQPFHVNIFLAAAAGEASSFVCSRGSSLGQNLYNEKRFEYVEARSGGGQDRTQAW